MFVVVVELEGSRLTFIISVFHFEKMHGITEQHVDVLKHRDKDNILGLQSVLVESIHMRRICHQIGYYLSSRVS